MATYAQTIIFVSEILSCQGRWLKSLIVITFRKACCEINERSEPMLFISQKQVSSVGTIIMVHESVCAYIGLQVQIGFDGCVHTWL